MGRRIPVRFVEYFTKSEASLLNPQENEPTTIRPQQEAKRSSDSGQDIPSPTVGIPMGPQGPQSPYHRKKTGRKGAECRDRWRLGVEMLAFVIGVIGLFALIQTLRETRRATDTMHGQLKIMDEQLLEMRSSSADAKAAAEAAQRSAVVAEQALILSERPWILATYSIAQPLTFGEDGKVRLELNEILENVGNSVALDVSSQLDIVPLAPERGKFWQPALSRQKEFCDGDRHPHPQEVPGDVLFPNRKQGRPMVMGMGKERIEEVLSLTHPGTDGQKVIGFAVVGCVSYRASFEPWGSTRHQTRVMYDLAKLVETGGIRSHVVPSGIHQELQLWQTNWGNSAD